MSLCRYATFISSLESLSLDNLEFVKDRAIKTIYDLLVSRPEQESNLLSLLVNKLGDPERKLASKVGYLLTKLLTKHPAMKGVVLREVERFVFRPGLTDRARYYAVVYLNQMVLSHKDSGVVGAGGGSLARRLVDLYFTLFKLIMEGKVGTAASLAGAAKEKAAKEAAAYAARRGKKKAGAAKEARGGKKETEGKEESMNQGDGRGSGEMDARMLSALITGVRRAFPYVAPDEVEPLIEAHSGGYWQGY